MTGLLAMLSDRLGLPMRGAQFVGCWRAIDERDSLRVARTGSAAPRLGGTSVLGRRTWDQAGGIRIEFLELSRERFAALLPGGRDHELAAWLIRCYVQQDLDVQFVLNLASLRTACVLGGASAPRLGWTSWVTGAHGSTSSNGPVRAPAPVRLTLRAAAAAAAPVRHH